MQHRSVEVMHMHRVLDGGEAELVARSHDRAALDAAVGQPAREATVVVNATVRCRTELAGSRRPDADLLAGPLDGFAFEQGHDEGPVSFTNYPADVGEDEGVGKVT